MDSRGNLAANNFLLPQVAPAQSQQPQAYDDGLSALQDIQHVKGQTGDYYNKVMGLKSFMHNAQNNLGIDVRVPDMSRPESVRLHQIYNTALADILAQGNLLHTSRATQMARENRGDIYAPGIDPNAQPADTLAYGQDVFARAAQPTVTEANNLTQQPSYDDQSYAQKLQEYEDKKAYYDDLIAKDPAKAEQYKYQKSILTPPARAIKQFAPQRDSSTYQDRRTGRLVETGGNWLKKITNLSAGAHDSFKPDSNNLNENGHPYLVSKEMAGDKFGESAIAYWKTDPDTKETTLVLKDGQQIPANTDPATIARTTLGSNSSTYGIDGSYIDAYIDKNNLRDEFGQVQKDKLLGKDYQKLQEKKVKESQKAALTSGPAVEDLKKKITSMTSSLLLPNDVVKAGKFEIEKSYGKDAYIIKNIKTVFPPASFKKLEDANRFYSSFSKWPDNDPEKLAKWLISKGAHIEDYKSKLGTNVAPTTPSSTPKSVSINTIKSKVGTAGFEGYTEQELINYYKGQGYTIN